MLKRTLAGVIAGVLSQGAATAEEPIDLIGQRALASLQCAMLAAHAGDSIVEKGESERLFRFGAEVAEAFQRAFRAQVRCDGTRP